MDIDDLFHFPIPQHLVGHLRLLQSKVSFAGGGSILARRY